MLAFVILHYKNINDTIECLESIKELNNQEQIKIIIVDNHTLNEEEHKLLKEYTQDIILLEDNLGFAKANNEGAKYAIKKYHPDYLYIINNDTIINQKDILEKIDKIYKETDFDILGPYIEAPLYSGSVNPYKPLKNKEEVKRELAYQNKLLKIYENTLLYKGLVLGMKIKHMFKKRKVMTNAKERLKDVALHGCAIIFSKKYYEKYSDIFYPNTFLYHEESFLYHRVTKDNLISIYDPDIHIIHKEGASLDTSFHGKEREKKIFRTKEIIKSLELLNKEMNEWTRKKLV